MINIPIQAIPNQTLSINLDNDQYDIALFVCDNSGTQAEGIMAVDIVRNGTPIVTGMRAVANFPIIPYAYLENGNFIITTNDDDLPDYRQFGLTQSLLFATQAELDAFRSE